MVHLVNYIWQSSFCLLFFFGVYWCFLKGEKVFNFTRIFLLVTPVLALCFPLIEIPVEFSKPSISLENTAFLQALAAQQDQEDIVGTFGLPEVTVSSTKLPILLEWKDYLFLAYLFVTLLLTVRLLWQFLQLRLLKEKGWYQTVYKLKGNYYLIPTFGLAPVFSFFDKLFWDDTQKLKPEEQEQIIKHELEHIRQGHSWDMIYYQVISTLFWFNPGIHLMRSALIDTHEFSADENVIKQTQNRETYTNLIVKIAFKGLDLPVGNHFIRSSTLKRIMMMKKSKKTNWFKLLMVLPLTAMLLGLVSMKTTHNAGIFSEFSTIGLEDIKRQIVSAQDSINVNTKVIRLNRPKHYEYVSALKNGTVIAQLGELQYEIGNISDLDEYRKVLEMIEIFKGNSSFEKHYNTDEIVRKPETMPSPIGGLPAWNEAVSENLKLSDDAKKLGISGSVFVEFLVDKDGNIKEPTILRSLGGGLDDVVLDMFSSGKLPKWKPGKNGNTAVNTLVVVPVNFKNDSVVKFEHPFFPAPKKNKAVNSTTNSLAVYDLVEEMPVTRGGMDKWNTYLAKNLKYPTEARKNGVVGTVYAQFIIDETGKVTHPQILRGIGGGLDEEVLRVLKNAPEWDPGKHNGEKVSVKLHLPVRFSLNTKLSPKINFPESENILEEVVVMGYNSQPKPKPTDNVSIGLNGQNPALILVNGQEFSSADLKKLDSEDIEGINVLKGKKAIDKYADKGKNGVVEITLKENASVPEEYLDVLEDQIEKGNINFNRIPESERPLLMIDGAISKLPPSLLDPKKIATISVLKDGKAIDLYGSVAQNGVILITTKK